MKPYHPLLAVIAAVAALAAGVYAATVWRASNAPPALQSGVLLDAARPIAPFTLTDDKGHAFANAQLQGRWSLLFAGFTHCPDVCPTTLAVMGAVESQLADAAPRLLFLSLDPERDTPEVLRRYARHFSPNLTAVSGSRDQLEMLCSSLGLAFVRVPGASEREYTIDHSAALVLIDPQGRVAGYFPPPHRADTLAADLRAIIGVPS